MSFENEPNFMIQTFSQIFKPECRASAGRSRRVARRPHNANRHGLVLIVVTVLIALMTVAALGSVALMQSEYAASRMRGDELILENTAESAGEFLASISRLSRQQRAETMKANDKPSLFRNQSLENSQDNESGPYFSILQTETSLGDGPAIGYGFTNESAKLHLQTLLAWESKWPGAGERALLQLPGMTQAVADKILDWIDSDSTPRMLGAEADKYSAQGSNYVPRNAIPRNLDELLLIPGVTRADLFGRTSTSRTRGSGRATSVGPQTSEPVEHAPWSQFLTVNSGERNESYDGQPRINLNAPDLTQLHQQLQAAVGGSWADFVIAYRQFGPARNPRGLATTTFEPDFSVAPKFDLRSELDLIGAKVAVSRLGRSPVILSSPLGANRAGWSGELTRVMDRVTTDSRKNMAGRINIELASREVLLMIPELDPATVDRILATRLTAALGESEHVHATWLLEQGFVDARKMRGVLPFVTTGGDVFQAEILAYFVDRPLHVRNLVAVDGTASKPHQLYWKDLRDQPMAYPLAAVYAADQTD